MEVMASDEERRSVGVDVAADSESRGVVSVVDCRVLVEFAAGYRLGMSFVRFLCF